MERRRQGRYDDDDEEEDKIQYQVLQLGKVLCKYVNLHRFVLAKGSKRGEEYRIQWIREGPASGLTTYST